MYTVYVRGDRRVLLMKEMLSKNFLIKECFNCGFNIRDFLQSHVQCKSYSKLVVAKPVLHFNNI